MSAPLTQPWWQPRGFEYSRTELALMRMLFAVMIYSLVKWETGDLSTQRFPNGIAHWFDLTWLAAHPPGWWAKGCAIAGLLAYVVGALPALGLAPILFWAIVTGTLLTSQSSIVQHSWQLGTMILLAQWCVYAWHWRGATTAVHRLATYASTVVIAASYGVCGVVKLVASDFQWVQRAPLMSVQLMKSNWAHYYNFLETPPAWLTQATQAIVDYPNLARLFFGGGLLIELGAFVVLISRGWALFGGVMIIVFHLTVTQIMQLDFFYHIMAAAIFLVLPGLIATWQRRAAGR
jgi:hypothetical protein